MDDFLSSFKYERKMMNPKYTKRIWGSNFESVKDESLYFVTIVSDVLDRILFIKPWNSYNWKNLQSLELKEISR